MGVTPRSLSPRHPALSNLPGVHREAIEAIMNEVSPGLFPSPLGIVAG